jgi:ribose/xylose/arabinose/galactoside ABC-type transport system permease subunit
MTQKIGAFISNNRRFIPLSATIALFFIVYAFGAVSYEGMRDPQVFLNLFRTSPFLLISAIGMTMVILTGGIDLSVSGVVALTTVASAALLREGENPWSVMLLMLVMGMALGAIMGAFITYLKVQPFIATLAGMWFARGMCFVISDDAIPIDNRIYRILGQTKILIPGLSDPVTKQGPFISILVVVALVVLVVAMYIAQYTRFGRTMYAIGGNEGRNEQSARLMGLPVNTTKMLVYTLNGFCSALAGITLSIYVSSGHGLYARGFELTAINAVVMGGTMLTGGVGYVFGTLFGVLITGVIQTLIQFEGTLSSWWTNIVVGALALIFIGTQSLVAARKGRRLAGGSKVKQALAPGLPAILRSRRMLLFGGGAIAVIVLAVLAIIVIPKPSGGESVADTPIPESAACQFKPFRDDQAANFMEDGAVLAYERNGGAECIDELYAIYPDGRIVGDDGTNTIEKQVTPEEANKLLSDIDDRGWFTDEIYDTWHTPCGQCFEYHITVSYQGQEKTVKAVDGGTDAPADYWQVVSLINKSIPKFPSP